METKTSWTPEEYYAMTMDKLTIAAKWLFRDAISNPIIETKRNEGEHDVFGIFTISIYEEGSKEETVWDYNVASYNESDGDDIYFIEKAFNEFFVSSVYILAQKSLELQEK